MFDEGNGDVAKGGGELGANPSPQSEGIGVCEQSVVRYGAVDRGVVEELIDHVSKAIEKALQKRKLWIVCE